MKQIKTSSTTSHIHDSASCTLGAVMREADILVGPHDTWLVVRKSPWPTNFFATRMRRRGGWPMSGGRMAVKEQGVRCQPLDPGSPSGRRAPLVSTRSTSSRKVEPRPGSQTSSRQFCLQALKTRSDFTLERIHPEGQLLPADFRIRSVGWSDGWMG